MEKLEHQSKGDVESLVRQLRRKGVSLWSDGDSVRYRAPRGVLTDDERQRLGDGEVVALLMRHWSEQNAERPQPGPQSIRRAPLSFTQLEHWNDRCASGGRPILSVVSAALLHGNVDVPILRESLRVVRRRHDALRTTVVVDRYDVPMQEISDRDEGDLETDRVGKGEKGAAEIDRQMQRIVLGVNEYATGPLFRAVLLSVDESEHLLVLAIDHIIGDLYSLNVVFRETVTAYSQLQSGATLDMPTVSVQFPEHAEKLRARAGEIAVKCARRLGNASRTHFPRDIDSRFGARELGWGVLRFQIDSGMVADLRACARKNMTTSVLAMLTAYAALVMRWCGVDQTLIPFMIDGRLEAELENAVGYFAFPIYVRVRINARSTFLDLLKQVTDEYCGAHDDADHGYALSRLPRPQCVRNTMFNWLPTPGASGAAAGRALRGGLACEPFQVANPAFKMLELDQEPCVSFSEQNGMITGQVSYAHGLFSERLMRKFADNVVVFLRALIATPAQRVLDAPVL